MAKQGVKIFNLAESYAGGGTFFTDGLYRVEEAKFVLYDFNGALPDAVTCLMMKLQPLNAQGKDEGDAVPQYWGCGDQVKDGEHSVSPINKGAGIELNGDYTTIWKGCDFFKFMEALQKAEFDMDAYEESDDISALEGLVAEFGKITDSYQPKNKKKDGDDDDKKKGPRQIIVVTNIPDTKGSSKGKGSAGKGKEKEEEKTTTSKGKGKSKGGDEDAESLLQSYLADEVLVEKNSGGIKRMQARMGIVKYLSDKEPATVKEVQSKFNDSKVLGAILDSAGWELDGDTIKQAD